MQTREGVRLWGRWGGVGVGQGGTRLELPQVHRWDVSEWNLSEWVICSSVNILPAAPIHIQSSVVGVGGVTSFVGSFSRSRINHIYRLFMKSRKRKTFFWQENGSAKFRPFFGSPTWPSDHVYVSNICVCVCFKVCFNYSLQMFPLSTNNGATVGICVWACCQSCTSIRKFGNNATFCAADSWLWFDCDHMATPRSRIDPELPW